MTLFRLSLSSRSDWQTIFGSDHCLELIPIVLQKVFLKGSVCATQCVANFSNNTEKDTFKRSECFRAHALNASNGLFASYSSLSAF